MGGRLILLPFLLQISTIVLRFMENSGSVWMKGGINYVTVR
jgi:hypothetical protein